MVFFWNCNQKKIKHVGGTCLFKLNIQLLAILFVLHEAALCWIFSLNENLMRLMLTSQFCRWSKWGKEQWLPRCYSQKMKEQNSSLCGFKNWRLFQTAMLKLKNKKKNILYGITPKRKKHYRKIGLKARYYKSWISI